jgi:hypothetical protein
VDCCNTGVYPAKAWAEANAKAKTRRERRFFIVMVMCKVSARELFHVDG